MKFNNNKKILSFTLSFILATGLFCLKKDSDFKSDIYINNEISYSNYYKSCTSGDIYIGNEDDINNLISNNVDGIFVVDERDKEDPNMKIIDSYKINDKENMKEVLYVLKQYDKENPSKWSRKIYTMINEWVVHNYLYNEGMYISHTKDVDLNNDDEDDYSFLGSYKLLVKKKDVK